MKSFSKKDNNQRQEPSFGKPIDMNELARKIEEDYPQESESPPTSPRDYAPPALRGAPTPPMEQVKTFAELPTKELDEIVTAAEAEIAELKRDAQAVRDMYTKHTQRITADIERLREGVRLSMETMEALRVQCLKLDATGGEEK